MPDETVQDQESIAKALMETVAHTVIGARIRRERLSQKISIRDLAARADLGKSSIVRLEAGAEFRPITVVKVCRALGLDIEKVGKSSRDDAVAIHRSPDDRWFEFGRASAGVLGDFDRPLSREDRKLLVLLGAKNPQLLLQSSLGKGKVRPSLIELYQRTETRTHPGEEFLFVMRGRLKLTVGSSSYELEAGESADFWGSEPHSFEPMGEGDALILSIRVNP